MYTLTIANKNYSSWSLRPWVLLKVLEIPFTERLLPFDDEAAWEQFRSVLPNGKVPTLEAGVILVWESLSIVETLAEAHPEVWPKDKVARAWARSAAAEMHSGFHVLRTICSMNCGVRIRLNEVSSELQKDLSRLQTIWTEGLTRFGGPYLAGKEFTAVDAFFAPVTFRVQTYQLKLDEVSMAYVKRMLDLPAMQEWYEDALKEPWREIAHEEDSRAHGILVQDLRTTL
jgi:glutathione S-transferase